MRSLLLLVALSVSAAAIAQGPPSNGPATNNPGWHALVGADAVVQPGQRIRNATLVVRDGRIVSIESGSPPPAGAFVHDCRGLILYPGLIEPFLTVDVPPPDPDAANVHWHAAVTPQRNALDGTGTTEEDREELRELGFATAAIAPTGGVLKGSSAIVLLDEPAEGAQAVVVRNPAYALASLQRSFGNAPNSEMGAIALLRQMLSDANWQEQCTDAAKRHPELQKHLPQTNDALSSLVTEQTLPILFDVEDELQVLRVAKIADEFSRPAMALGRGMEFRRLDAIAATGMPLVIPVHFPEAPDVTSLAKAERVSLRQLQTWEQAPTNLARLLGKNATVALTTTHLPKRSDFRKKLAEAMQFGVSEDQALAALTTVPARMLGVSNDLGTLQAGHYANIVVVDGDLFDPGSTIRDVWVGGQRHVINEAKDPEFDGRWTLTVGRTTPVSGKITVADGKVTAQFGDEEVKARSVQQDQDRLEFLIADASFGGEGSHWCRVRLQEDRLVGAVFTAGGAQWDLTATREDAAADPEDSAAEESATETLRPLPVPLGAYGTLSQPQAQTAVFHGATLWTCADQGVVVGSLYVKDGRIVYAGPRDNLPALPPGTAEVDCSGKHITPGLIDCHSHTGISRGVNESGETITAEVRVQDVINPSDVNWYRQLAGGVTAVNQLHGSANPIGGQSSTVKIRWGVRHPDEMVFANNVPGIKFALGENPRRANGRSSNSRYPNTRMGVEALIRDRFLAAVDYARRLQEYEGLSAREQAQTLPPRRDLELEALAQILANERRIHCHSYRQDEIFMLCQMAKEFGFKIGTFQHVLEGYKVADAIQETAYGASSFSDWWAYKFEVYDAIPDNGSIMHEAGVCVSFNSDSSEHARRLNTEAGKAVKYGGVDPAEALCFVTLNPAIQLGIQDRTGSLEAGKDADFAIWSDEPLNYTSICEATWVDGKPMFTKERDRELRAAAAQERQRLLQKALAAAQRSGRTAKNDVRDAYWAAEDMSEHYCCRNCAGGQK